MQEHISSLKMVTNIPIAKNVFSVLFENVRLEKGLLIELVAFSY